MSEYKRLYDELHSLGSGAFGEVFVVKWKYDGREYAVKKIKYESNWMYYIFIIRVQYYNYFSDYHLLICYEEMKKFQIINNYHN